MERIATAPAVLDRAAAMVDTVAYVGRGQFTVQGRSDRYTVAAPDHDRTAVTWSCTCKWGQNSGRLCAHVRAADLWLAEHSAGWQAA